MKQDLLLRAREALRGQRRPKSVVLRRAVSDSYYAVFHALCQLGADTLIGVTQRHTEAWRRAYRGYNHGFMKDQFKDKKLRQIDPSFSRISTAFILLQESRHEADYDPQTRLRSRGDILPLIQLAEATVLDIDALSIDLARQLSTLLLIKTR